MSSCDAGSIRVRPSGNSPYPPKISTPNPSGFTIEIDLGEEGLINMEVTAEAISTAADGLYTEWVGTMNGSVNGGKQMTGVASFEMFKLTN